MLRIGIICPSEIAFRRFMPALKTIKNVEFVGLGVCSFVERFGNQADESSTEQNEIIKKQYDSAQKFISNYGGKIFNSYEKIVTSDEIDAVYIPLPPALHFKWAKLALENGKHVLVEKPSTINSADTKILTEIAKKRKLALHENYMFVFHKQLDEVENILKSGEIGDIRLYRISFGFPRRELNDFRYNRALGGGALIDAGGYTIKYATRILGDTAEIMYAQMNYTDNDEVDIYGSAALVNKKGVTVQVAYGMDNNYKCELEVWGSKGCLTTGRILTAPVGFEPSVTIRKGNEDDVRKLPADDSFRKSINYFLSCIDDDERRKESYKQIERQADLVDQFRCMAEVKLQSK